ncbi:hypothetical protein L2E82_01627 [Cichorium intybus]|uniref:Uncharacterized protein n=1 Tax=Cichorium intybus TaxID=13427 RepID=A0ACB9GZE0_CICIN|nr:hypothetical protein L2E82_01627 [Cichorium intybus]
MLSNLYENLACNGGIELRDMKLWKEMMRGGREAVSDGVLREEQAESIVPQENGGPLVPMMMIGFAGKRSSSDFTVTKASIGT